MLKNNKTLLKLHSSMVIHGLLKFKEECLSTFKLLPVSQGGNMQVFTRVPTGKYTSKITCYFVMIVRLELLN